jgi:periplasmic divalent cation tolerance protein
MNEANRRWCYDNVLPWKPFVLAPCVRGAKPEFVVTLNVILMLTTVPDEDAAEKLSTAALEARLAACVTRLGAVHSQYYWQGRIESGSEIQLLFKTSLARAAELEQFIQTQHPYETPEILSWQVTASNAYGQWVNAETQRPLHV